MPRIITTHALCLAAERRRESSKLVTLFSEDSGRLLVSARGARRPKSRFGAALERFAESRITFYWRESRATYTASDTELIRSYAGLALLPARYLAAEQVTEFLLRTIRPLDPMHCGPVEATGRLFRLTTAYFDVLETAEAGFRDLVASYLLKSASFLGYKPEFSRCLACRQGVDPTTGSTLTYFVPARGGVVCGRCSPPSHGILLSGQAREGLAWLLCTPAAEIALCRDRRIPQNDHLRLALLYASCHLDPLILNSFNWDTL